MADQQRDQVNQSPPVSRAPRTHIVQLSVKPAQLKTPAGAHRDPVNQSPVNK
jgi:hypothetical protein